MKSEFEFIESLKKRTLKIQNSKSKIKNGIGDDCAIIRQNSKTDLVITTDLLIEDIDFRLSWTTPEFLGHKALAVSLSDVAAMGAKPVWALISIGIPQNIWNSDFVERFYKGWYKLAKKFNVELVGGDVSRTPDKIVIDSIVAGETKKDQGVLRSNAQVEDLIFVTGELGGASVGLNVLEDFDFYQTQNKKWLDSSAFEKLRLRQLCPQPQLATATILSQQKLATAMIDLSDGLSSDLAHLCAASRVGARIEANQIPIDKNIPANNFNAFAFAINGGEDYELLFTVNPKNLRKLKRHISNVSQIGVIVNQKQGIMLRKNKEFILLETAGYKHF